MIPDEEIANLYARANGSLDSAVGPYDDRYRYDVARLLAERELLVALIPPIRTLDDCEPGRMTDEANDAIDRLNAARKAVEAFK